MLNQKINRVIHFCLALLVVFLSTTFTASELKAQACPITVDFAYSSNCVQGSIQFTEWLVLDSGTILSHAWDFGDGSPIGTTPNPTYIYSTPGIYQVTLTINHSNGCAVSKTHQLTVDQLPQVEFTSNDVCLGNSVVFQNVSTPGTVGILNWTWDFGDGTYSNSYSPTHQYATTGVKTIILSAIDNNGCTHSFASQVEVFDVPMAGFISTSQCSENLVQFQDTSSSPNGAIISTLWDFGDGSYSVQTNPLHYYATIGQYNVELTVTDVFGCSGISIATLHVVQPWAVTFSSDTVCLGDAMSFAGTVTSQGTQPLASWSWDFGDGNTAMGQQVSHTYQVPGYYMVNLLAEDAIGCMYNTSQQVLVLLPPSVGFVSSPVFFGDTTEFSDVSIPGASPISQRTWDFGDGTPPLTTTATQVKHAYTSPGNYNVGFMAHDLGGCQSSTAQLVDVWSNYLKASWVADTVCEGERTCFQDETMVGTGSVVAWNWRFGDGSESQQQNPTHTYYLAGTYHVILVVTTDIGVIDSAQAWVIVNPTPKAAFDYTSICQEDKKVFYNQSTISSGNINSWAWNLGDGFMSTLYQPERPYYTPGNYQITLVVSSDHGCTDTITHPFDVFAKPEVDFIADKYMGCGIAEVKFTDKSTISEGFLQTWNWEFGDGSSSMNPGTQAHTYTDIGSYNVSLTVTSNKGCATKKALSSLIHVRPKPVSEFTFDPGDAEISRPTVIFMNNSTGADFCRWNFGDGHSTTAYNPVHNFTKEGVFTITLRVETNYGCVDASSKTIRVTSEPTLFVPDAFTPNGDGINDFFAPAGYAYQSDDGKTMTFQIYTRVGQLIYDSSQNPNPWDGRIMGSSHDAPTGVYVCKVVAVDAYGKKLEQMSRLTLYR